MHPMPSHLVGYLDTTAPITGRSALLPDGETLWSEEVQNRASSWFSIFEGHKTYHSWCFLLLGSCVQSLVVFTFWWHFLAKSSFGFINCTFSDNKPEDKRRNTEYLTQYFQMWEFALIVMRSSSSSIAVPPLASRQWVCSLPIISPWDIRALLHLRGFLQQAFWTINSYAISYGTLDFKARCCQTSLKYATLLRGHMEKVCAIASGYLI